jgi:transcriptional regulator with XRE-family HTH domain
MDAMTIRIKLRDTREKAGLTQAELAKRVRVRQATISAIENGKAKRFDLPTLDRICRVLHIKLHELLVRDGDK